jgi:hypothetical protein
MFVLALGVAIVGCGGKLFIDSDAGTAEAGRETCAGLCTDATSFLAPLHSLESAQTALAGAWQYCPQSNSVPRSGTDAGYEFVPDGPDGGVFYLLDNSKGGPVHDAAGRYQIILENDGSRLHWTWTTGSGVEPIVRYAPCPFRQIFLTMQIGSRSHEERLIPVP